MQRLQEDIDKLRCWARKCCMRFQPVKCNMMSVTRKRSKARYQYKLEGSVLSWVKSVKYLGVTISEDLRWNVHIGNTCSKAYRTLGLLRRNLSGCPPSVRETAYKGFIRPVLEYASVVWDPHCKKLTNDLEKVQNRSARFVLSDYSYEPGSMTNIMQRLQWKPLKTRRKHARMTLLYKGLQGMANIPTKDLIQQNNRTRNQHDLSFRIPYSRTDCYKHSFIPRTIRDWNALPQSVTASAEMSKTPISTFVNEVKSLD